VSIKGRWAERNLREGLVPSTPEAIQDKIIYQHTRLKKMEKWPEETLLLLKLSKKKSNPCEVIAAFEKKMKYVINDMCSKFQDHVKTTLEKEFNSTDVDAAMTNCGNSSSRRSRSRSGCAGGNCGD
jgi:hypothetical protein